MKSNNGLVLKVFGIILSLATTILGLYIKSVDKTVDDVIAIKPQFEQLKIDVRENEQWQKDWERAGELPADIKQDEKIKFLSRTVEKLEYEVSEIKEQIQEIKIAQAKN